MSSTKDKLLPILNFVVILSTIGVNALANILPINGVGTGAVANSDAYFNFFTPAVYVFSIWGVIYFLLIVFGIYQLRPSEKGKEYIGQIGVLFILNGIFNMLWIFVFHYSVAFGDVTTPVREIFALSMVPMAFILITLLLIYLKLGVGVKSVPTKEKLAVHVPFSVYAGWISVAIIANTASTINTFLTIDEATQHLWTALVLVVALVITLLMLFLRRDFAFGLVVVWATVGIYAKHSTIQLIAIPALAAAVVVAVIILILPFIKKKNWVDYYLVRS